MRHFFDRLPALVVERRRMAMTIWALIAIALVPFARGAESHLDTGTRVPGSESERVAKLLRDSLVSPFGQYAVLVVDGMSDSAGARAQTLHTIGERLRLHRAVSATVSEIDRPDSLFLGGAHTTFMIVGLAKDVMSPDSVLPSLRHLSSEVQRDLSATQPSLKLLWTGELPLTVDLRRVSGDNVRMAERRVLPLTLLMLVVAFGAVMAAALPVAIGALSIAMTMGVVVLLARVFPVSILVLNVATMLGLGLGIDYALLLVSRFREARARGLDPQASAIEAAHHAGHSILLSGAAVTLGFVALLLAPLSDLRSIAIGGIVVTVMSMLLATTLLPGVLAMLGARTELLRLRRNRGGDSALWHTWSTAVVRRPVTALMLAGIPVAFLAWQWRHLETRTPSGAWLPASMESARGLEALEGMGRAGIVEAVRAVVELPAESPATTFGGQAALMSLTAKLKGNPLVARLTPGAMSRDGHLVLLEIMPTAGGGMTSAMQLVRELRALDLHAIPGLRDTRLAVGGLPAFNVDYGDAIKHATPRVVALVVLGTFLALVIGFRSLLVPVKAIALNMASVGAAFGAVVLVFQRGHGVHLVGMSVPLDAIFPAVPLLAFCVVFGLSMDYEVFLVSRVAEARQSGADEAEAVVRGVEATGGVITSAALVMIVVFGAFMIGEFVFMKILGFALSFAVLLDATLVRLVLGPALLRLAGRWNWWPGTRATPARLVRRDVAGLESVY